MATPYAATVSDVAMPTSPIEVSATTPAEVTVTVTSSVTGDEGEAVVPVTLMKQSDTGFSAVENASFNTAGTSATAAVTFTVDEPGTYYATAGGKSSIDAGGTGETLRIAAARHTPSQADKDWDTIVPSYSVKKVDGVYSVDAEGYFGVESVADVFGNPVEDYSVVYLDASGNVLAADDTVGQIAGGYPEAPSATTDFQIAIVDGDTANADLAALGNVNGIREFVGPAYVQKFTITVEQKSLEGAAVYEYDASASTYGIDDETFAYKGAGKAITVGIKLDGDALTDAEVSGVQVKKAPTASAVSFAKNLTVSSSASNGVGVTITDADGETLVAGDYVLTVFGKGEYANSVDVPFTVEKLDLSQAVATTPDVEGADGATIASLTAEKFEVGDEPLATEGTDTLKILDETTPVEDFSYTNIRGVTTGSFSNMNWIGSYTYKLNANADNENVTGTGYPVVNRYATMVTFNYGDIILNGTSTQARPFETFVASKGEAFDPAEISCSDAQVDFTYKVYDAEGAEATDLTQPGLYKLVVTAVKYADYSIGGTGEGWFKVEATDFDPSKTTAYAAIDGKMLHEQGETVTTFDYTGKAFEPVVVVKDEKGRTVEASLYTVSVLDEDGAAVESVVEPGEYKVVVKFVGFDESYDVTFLAKVDKAEIVSAKADADFYPVGTEPSFLGYTEAECKGQEFELSADQLRVTYKDSEGTVVKAADLEPGEYTADIAVLTTDPRLEGSVEDVPFTVSETVVFHDVDAGAWYAGSVYDAAVLGYMDGVAEGIFAPERAMTRAEFAQVVYNMATNGLGGTTEPGVTYPTKYTDVPADAWYAKAIEWASRYGIVNGTSETTFDPNGTVTREQVATMLYRYAGNEAQADLSVLDQFDDAEQISAYAENAMAWAVENGYVNGVSDTALAPAETATRAQIAAIAVRVQPERL